MRRVVIFFVSLCHLIIGYHIDPTDFFLGAQHRPKLEILRPENGEVLDDNDLEIRIKLGGYEVPSSFHDSKVCIGLSSGTNVAEGCFEQTSDLVFHANGLSPGQQYSLQVSFYERGKVIAVSVRNFRVGGIRGLVVGSDEPVTIMTAVQLAIQYQARSMMQQAEEIYRSILSEHPNHANALHLMGVIFFQRGDPLSAIPYIQRAMLGNKTDEAFFNSLGECYRNLGRVDEAIEQYQTALTINPRMLSGMFNLGRAYQDKRRWRDAIASYRAVQEEIELDYEQLAAGHPAQSMREDAMLRECDLLQASRRLLESVDCWKRGIALYPDNQFMYNELGNLLGQNGQYEDAYELYRVAVQKGSTVAELNGAHILEQLGYHIEAVEAYEDASRHAIARGMPQFHIQVRKAMVLPRILPASASVVAELRAGIEANLDILLRMESATASVDNAPPLYFGYSLGYYLACDGLVRTVAGSVGVSNLVLKSKLYRVYARMCPALLQGYFVDNTSDQQGSDNTALTLGSEQDDDKDNNEEDETNDTKTFESEAESIERVNTKMEPASLDEREESAADSMEANSTDSLNKGVDTHNSDLIREVKEKVEDHNQKYSLNPPSNSFEVSTAMASVAAVLASGTSVSSSGAVTASTVHYSTEDRQSPAVHGTSAVGSLDSGSTEVVAPSPGATMNAISTKTSMRGSYKSPWRNAIPHFMDKTTGKMLTRIGFVSRYMQLDHAAGAFVHGLVPLLAQAQFEVIVFHIDSVSNKSHPSWDVVKSVIQNQAHVIGFLPLNLGDCVSVIREAAVDVLIFPEIGMDPMSYFLSYSRLAPVQAAWLAHPDTSGVATVDYFLGSDVEGADAQGRYSERLHRFRNLGTVFVDTFGAHAASRHSSPRTTLLERARFIEDIGLPRSAHLYIVAQPMDRLHPDFDAALAKLLLQDRLGYIMFLDPSPSALRRSWKHLFVMRMAGSFSDDIRDRMLFIKPHNHSETMRALSVGHVMLDPFPVSGLLSNLQALALGVPVVTWPSEPLGGRYALALYKQMDYVLVDNETASNSGMIMAKRATLANGNVGGVGDDDETEESPEIERVSLIVSSLNEYVATALSITHKPKLRERLVRDINNRRYRLFDDPLQRKQVVEDWKAFVSQALKDAANRKETDKPKKFQRK